jgi:hypothetical protein
MVQGRYIVAVATACLSPGMRSNGFAPVEENRKTYQYFPRFVCAPTRISVLAGSAVAAPLNVETFGLVSETVADALTTVY